MEKYSSVELNSSLKHFQYQPAAAFVKFELICCTVLSEHPNPPISEPNIKKQKDIQKENSLNYIILLFYVESAFKRYSKCNVNTRDTNNYKKLCVTMNV